VPGAITRGARLKDRYRLERTLGRGGMAAVWVGHDEVLDRPVAVKVLSDTIASDPSFVDRFRREARVAAGLSHPNLVRVYDFSEEGERPYLVMQLVPGEDLATRLGRGERVDCDQLALELLGALSHVHRSGILHRDVKPGNIVIEPNGTAKLIDFGIALPSDATALTSTGLVLGTERYVAPEVLEGRSATERSDLYSCGLVLQACAGGGSPELRALAAALASRDPRRRPRSAESSLARLRQPSVVERPTEVLEASSERRDQPLPRRRKIVATALGLLATLLVAGLVALGGGGPEGGGGREAKQANESKRETAKAEQAPPPQSSPIDPASGATLNEQGFAMVQAGEYEAAVPVLEEAVESFPEGTDDLDYAYALFNFGNALRLSGRPDEAIPVLERRLEIPNQEGEVLEELEAARAEAGEPASFDGD
jgi:eukaryotic-like serine/threonine-protein kinase